MVQVNSFTKFERKIKFCISGSSLISPDATTNSSKSIKWYYKDDQQQWSPYHPQGSSQLERWYQAGHSSVGRLHIGKHKYSVDFTAMLQVNVVRSILELLRDHLWKVKRGGKFSGHFKMMN